MPWYGKRIVWAIPTILTQAIKSDCSVSWSDGKQKVWFRLYQSSFLWPFSNRDGGDPLKRQHQKDFSSIHFADILGQLSVMDCLDRSSSLFRCLREIWLLSHYYYYWSFALMFLSNCNHYDVKVASTAQLGKWRKDGRYARSPRRPCRKRHQRGSWVSGANSSKWRHSHARLNRRKTKVERCRGGRRI